MQCTMLSRMVTCPMTSRDRMTSYTVYMSALRLNISEMKRDTELFRIGSLYERVQKEYNGQVTEQ